MRKFLSQLTAALIAVFLCGCSGDKETPLTVSTSSLNFIALGSTQSVSVTSDADLTATSSRPWCTAEVDLEQQKVFITAARNYATSQRSAEVRLTSGSQTQVIAITQKAGTGTFDAFTLSSDTFPKLNPTDSGEAKVKYMEGSYTITVTLKDPKYTWCVKVTEGGFVSTKYTDKQKGSGDFSFEVKANTTLKNRKAKLLVISEYEGAKCTYELSITQSKENNITIDWDEKSCHFVTGGVYARIKKVDNRFALVYDTNNKPRIRFSDDKCESWSEAIKVAWNDNYTYTNCELLQLQSGRLLYMWNARPHSGTGLPYKIMYALSDDKGNSWGEARDLYTAYPEAHNGCWEPIALQRPDGEIQIYFANEAPYTNSSEQEISMMRSTDNGESWSAAERVSFRAGSRDGMAVPIYLPHSKEIAVAIEDNGIRGRFKPVIVRTADNWKDGFVAARDARREEALTPEYAVHDTIYAGAPYLIRLGEKHTLLSIQSTEGRKGHNEKYANMQVYVGDKEARNFCNRSTPMPHLAENGSALWNSITQIDDETVIAVMSVGGMEPGGIWTVKGKIVEME